MVLGSIQPLTEVSTRIIFWGKGGRWVRLITLPPSCAVVMRTGNLNFLEYSGPLQACNGTALPFYCKLELKRIFQPRSPSKSEDRHRLLLREEELTLTKRERGNSWLCSAGLSAKSKEVSMSGLPRAECTPDNSEGKYSQTPCCPALKSVTAPTC
jgi:hypothetical protein